jgi:hypothetical protein
MVGTFYIFPEEIRRDFHGELGTVQGNGTDEFKPGVELLRIHIVLKDLQTVLPYRYMSLLVCHPGIMKIFLFDFSITECKDG